jgi:hypothetical protein
VEFLVAFQEGKPLPTQAQTKGLYTSSIELACMAGIEGRTAAGKNGVEHNALVSDCAKLGRPGR